MPVKQNKTRRRNLRPAHKTKRGAYYVGNAEDLLANGAFQKKYSGKIDLILTSPPFPLNNKKRYGNLRGNEYLKWITDLAPNFEKLLSPKGSLVIEIGNCWQAGRPVQSLLPLKTLFALASREGKGGLRLIQEFVCYNPSRLPSPAQWVTVNRLRVVDSYTHVWWLAKTDFPQANNSKVTRPYSSAMKDLLARGKYNHGRRPSQHKIGKNGFLKKQNGIGNKLCASSKVNWMKLLGSACVNRLIES
jgi:site-specific DNA-methyltransferase (cytosine-N4-specific)